MKKNMNENITTTQKYEKYYHNAKKYEKPEKYEKHKINGSGRESGETPATLAALAAPTENHMIVSLMPPFTTGPRVISLFKQLSERLDLLARIIM